MADAVTDLIARWSAGDRDALDALIPLVSVELRKIAAAHFRRERAGHTLQPTALVNEVYLRMLGRDRLEFQDRAHFMAVASRLMRQLLIDHARRHGAARRGGGAVRTELPDLADAVRDPVDVIALSDAIERLAALDARQGQLVELRCFGGLELAEIATVLGVSLRTVKREWATARLWLHRELKGEPG
jgi:RNA polymerase sigma-70 factor (ECF subfamily)